MSKDFLRQTVNSSVRRGKYRKWPALIQSARNLVAGVAAAHSPDEGTLHYDLA
jgi:hypothetical protein